MANKHNDSCVASHTGPCDASALPPTQSDILFIRTRFSKFFAETMNVLELALEGEKLNKVKDLISGFTTNAEHDILIHVQDKLN